jgi:hypothetical protein
MFTLPAKNDLANAVVPKLHKLCITQVLYDDAITIENLHTQMHQNLKLILFFLEDPFP